jgi:primosomal protein N' (replication factor Y)
LACVDCGSIDIIFKSIGTKSIAAELEKAFPKARIKRFDTDNLKSERLEMHYHDILAGKVDILVGTQMLAKGLDLPKLAVVGVIAADTSLYFPDYTAEERTYQLLNQVMGRVGRGHTAGSVVIQTYNPRNAAILAALKNKWSLLYESQLKERQKYGFPPFYHILKLTCARASQSAATTAADKLVTDLQQLQLPVIIDGPAPSFHEKIQGKYRWQLIIKAKQRNHLLDVIAILPSGWSYDIDPSNLL